MKKLTVLSLASVLAAASFVGCNSDYTPVEETSSSVVVYSFRLSKDDSILANLDTVFFSIDLDRARIFNADSLPYGTPINKLVPVIRMLETVSRANLTVKRADGSDTVYNYMTNSTDTIDFSNGPVILDVASPSGAVSRQYSIEVNVHRLKSDSLVWSENARRDLPTSLSLVKEQKTVRTSAGLYCLTSDGVDCDMAFIANPGEDNWDVKRVVLPANAEIKSLAGSSDALYIIAGGKLHTSSDGGASWTSTGRDWTCVFGGFGDAVIGSYHAADGWKFVQYPSDAEPVDIDADMPVCDVSVPLTFRFPMSDNAQAYIVGGARANGTLSPDTWAYDGKSWARISDKGLGKALKGVSVVPFYTFYVNDAFVVTETSVLMAFGGNNGTVNSRSVYLSDDFGLTWSEGGQLLQLPKYVPSMAFAQSYVFETELGSRAGSAWACFADDYRLPSRAYIDNNAWSRAIYPVTTWECPFIYTFGGVDDKGTLINSVWRATLNRLTFKPIQ